MDYSYPLSEQTLKVLDSQDRESVLLRISASFFRAFGVKVDSDELPQGIQPMDLAMDAIADLYEGRRYWDHEKHPDIAKFIIRSIIRSELDHLRKAEETRMI